MSGRALLAGSPEPLGLTLVEGGANVAVYSETAERIELCLFDARGQHEIARHTLPGRTGPVFHGFIPGLTEGALYGLRAHGPWRPQEGLRFNPQKLLLDPFALEIDGPIRLHDSFFGATPDGSPSSEDSGLFAPKAVAIAPVPAAPQRRKIAWSDTVLYELHVRGFTRRLESLPEEVRGTFAGLAHPVAVAHLKLLGVTTLEIMPCAAWIDERHLRAAGLTNYWGYNPIALLAPEPRLAPGGWREVRDSVAALQAAGFEVLIDVVLNHSGESDKDGPTLSLRGLDNAAYYRLDPAEPSRYIDDAGCGNILRLDHPAPLRLAMDSLRAWAIYGGVDGFRFDLATTLARRAEGFDPHAPLLAAIAQDPVLRDLKLIAEPWDIGPGGYQIGHFPAAWGEWNDQFRDAARKFWRGDGGMIGALATRLAGSADLFGGHKPPSRGVNFIAAHDGFTLADLVAYEHKHNEANGEENRDGTDANHSWNNGAEGETADECVLVARRRDQRNLLATLLLARGTPMLSMGAEMGQSQHGNNNAYAQDNETAWLDWDKGDARLVAFTRALIALRRTTPACTKDAFLAGAPQDGGPIPDVEWRGADGEILRDTQWGDGERRFLAVFFCTEASRAGVLFNAGLHEAHFRLPQPRENAFWRRALDTSAEDGAADNARFDCGETLIVAPRSTLVLLETTTPDRAVFEAPPQKETLAALARAVGLAPDWHEIDGTRHVPPDATKRALLKAMGFNAETQGQARESLKRLAAERDRRALPFALVFREGEPIILNMAAMTAPDALIVTDEAGEQRRLSLAANCREERRGCDGRFFAVFAATLPSLAHGRYRIALADEPETTCHLTIAPRACFWPEKLGAGAAGISAQVYSLRRDGDQGIGDFTALAELAEAAGRAGYATVGINPLHALFARDRNRASPYHPNDRTFLDPIYLDLDSLSDIVGAPLSYDCKRAHAFAEKASIDYPAVWALKAEALAACFEVFERAAADPAFAPAQDFEAFIAQSGERLRLYARGEAEARGLTGEQAERQIGFEQWLCDRQLARAAARGKTVGLWLGFYRDLAVGAAPDGAEVEAESGLFLKGVSVGAPPDPFVEGGQVWNLPPPDPLAMARDGYRAFAQLLHANMRHAGALRIDHVMALTRLFVVPDGAPALEGAYLAFPLDHLRGELALESHRAQCLVIGEDLGTVPSGFREAMSAACVASYRVLFFERWGENFAPPSAYPALALACASTHDLPTLIGWRRALDIMEKEALCLLRPEAAASERQRRHDDLARLFKALVEEGILPDAADPDTLPDADFVAAVHAYVARTPSALALFQIDDLLGETIGVNLPGTDRERPNWRRRLARPIGELAPAPHRRV